MDSLPATSTSSRPLIVGLEVQRTPEGSLRVADQVLIEKTDSGTFRHWRPQNINVTEEIEVIEQDQQSRPYYNFFENEDDDFDVPRTKENWKILARRFGNAWNFDNCIGAVDGKHITLQKPEHSGSYYYNYKGTYSIVLMGIANANYEFIMVDVGTNGRVSDGGDENKDSSLHEIPTDSGSDADDDQEFTFVDFVELEEFLLEHDPVEPGEDTGEPLDEFPWSDDYATFAGEREEFYERPGAKIKGIRPSGLFTQLWDEELMDSIVCETNRCAWEYIAKAHELEEGLPATSRVQDWVETSVAEIYRLIAIMILMGLCVRARIDEYWSSGVLAMPRFRTLMTKNRFLLLMKFLHFVDNRVVSAHGPEKKLAEIKPVLDHLNKKFKAAYTPRRELSIDESLLLWKGRLSWLQCIRTKAARFGIKSYELCEAVTGYVLNMIIYTGADPASTQALFGFTSVTAKVVINLFKDYLGKGYCLFMDSFYNSVRLSRFLKSQQTDVVGTLNRRRKDTPDDIRKLDEKKLARGTVVGRHCGDVSVVSWKDLRLVTTVSTYHNADVKLGKRAGNKILKPVVIQEYNKFMGGVDIKDQKLSTYLIERKRGLKWYIKVFRRLLNVTILNAYIIYSSNIGQQKKLRSNQQKKMTHRQFRYRLAEELLEQFGTDVKTRNSSNSKCDRLKRDLHHFPEYSLVTGERTTKQERYKRGRCVRCYALSERRYVRSNIFCSKCKVFLCVGQCWKDFHSLENL